MMGCSVALKCFVALLVLLIAKYVSVSRNEVVVTDSVIAPFRSNVPATPVATTFPHATQNSVS
jgi:hypothetical protein